MEINNTDLSEKMPLSDETDLSGSRVFDDSKIVKLNGIISQ